MKLALFDDHRLGVVSADDATLVDVTDALPWPHDADPVTAGWWRALCRDFPTVAPRLREAAATGTPRPVAAVILRAPVLGPSKVVAAASNYGDHVAEMHGVQQRTLGRVESWMMEFDVFLKAPSSIVGPGAEVVLPPDVVAAGHEVHHESELVVVIGAGGRDIPVESAMDAVLGFTAGLDITVRSAADRSRRKSYDTFSPLGPWLVTADEIGDGSDLDIRLTSGGQVRQSVNTRDLITPVPQIVAYASTIMTLLPGDVLFTGAPPGVGPIAAGEKLEMTISRIGSMAVTVR
ncbi:fumarylacetoacetate hydrolase family protein [Geodermatophilus sabuli]|uniref:2-keto-4-pentenoate hydratase/2-oxohepta-3-ene-1,7-dioic acid hydratase (Catechol pathway) n=1 Tax=Geodermatophilus sabuli TaxID=1564158 RepID=A0A285EAT6_9ACTN|nr:fumarylacetoacetate hydrolase family protein [Geodermatophilus sabuli]MBB3085324.1 2-keto-4-pentenoate hydratase/2-oxohepta-3-ene-1,7-dioic acid hydratase in catechol pathway [Geodermatophilus sabuli]SNX96248.1 2-keto-4-pentenoate hydratase/2-oxohepta-3-ene-1,7-dioic acid hydratase (catechol pathway) [Geodermatophilus sabuli]